MNNKMKHITGRKHLIRLGKVLGIRKPKRNETTEEYRETMSKELEFRSYMAECFSRFEAAFPSNTEAEKQYLKKFQDIMIHKLI